MNEAVILRSAHDAGAVPHLDIWTRLMLRLASAVRHGSITVVLPDARVVRAVGAGPGPDATIVLRNGRAARRLVTGGNLSLAEAYVDGDWDSPDLAVLAEWACRNADLAPTLNGAAWLRLLRRGVFALHANSRRGSHRNVARHYDLGNAFYAAWLDQGMTYSAALFDRDEQELEAAQRNKYARMLDLTQAPAGGLLLDVGCGWGGLAYQAAAERGLRVHAVTISRAQYEYAARRIQAAGLADRVRVELRDYRDLGGRYDAVVAIEMLEAVGERYWPQFFGMLDRTLAPGARAALQVITIDDRRFHQYRRSMDFIQKHIFPGGMLPSMGALGAAAAAGGFAIAAPGAFGRHYALTLAQWRSRFAAAWPRLRAQGFNERFRRRWEYYLAYCEGGFRAGAIDVHQLALLRR